MKRALALLGAATPVFAQCSMCRTALAANAQAAHAINKAVLILLLPAVALFSGVFVLAFRCRVPADESETNRRT